jgi:DNA-directed RNA polymerase specialized sigma24 family protein
MIKNPSEMLYSACIFMQYWAGLYPEDIQNTITAGVEIMMRTAINILEKQPERKTTRRITDGRELETEQDEDDQLEEVQVEEEDVL